MTTELQTWSAITAIGIASCIGDVLMSHAMKQVGDVGELHRRVGTLSTAMRVIRNHSFLWGVLSMTLAFYCLLYALSWDDLSLVGPAAAALTFVANAVAARIFLRERVDHRRWIAAILVAGGVVLLAR